MKKLLITSCLFLFLGMPVWAQDDLKLGVVDLGRVMDQSPQAEEARRALEAEFAPREKALVEKQRKLKELEERLLRDEAILSASERDRLQQEALRLRREIKREQEAFQDDLNFKRNQALERIQRKVLETVRAFAKEEGFDLLFADGVIYASPRMDVTEAVLERLRKAP